MVITPAKFSQLLSKAILDRFGTFVDAASYWNISRQYLHKVVNCQAPPPRYIQKFMLENAGLKVEKSKIQYIQIKKKS